jgi:hypothetical protein
LEAPLIRGPLARLAEAGCTANGIMSVLGHRTLAKAERYTRDADQARSRQPLSQNGRTHVEQTQDEQICPNQSAEFGKTDKNGRKIKVNKWRVALPRGLEPLFSP